LLEYLHISKNINKKQNRKKQIMSETQNPYRPEFRVKTPEQTNMQIERIARRLGNRAMEYADDSQPEDFSDPELRKQGVDVGGLSVNKRRGILMEDADLDRPKVDSERGEFRLHASDHLIHPDNVPVNGNYDGNNRTEIEVDRGGHVEITTRESKQTIKGNYGLDRSGRETRSGNPIVEYHSGTKRFGSRSNRLKVSGYDYDSDTDGLLGRHSMAETNLTDQQKRDEAAKAYEHVRQSIHDAEARRKQIREENEPLARAA
jgi:hypothetical protein